MGSHGQRHGQRHSQLHDQYHSPRATASSHGQRHDQWHEQYQSPRGPQLLGRGIGVLGTSPLRNNTGLGKQAPLRAALTPRTMASRPPLPYYDDRLRHDSGEAIYDDTVDAGRPPRLPLPEEDKYLKI